MSSNCSAVPAIGVGGGAEEARNLADGQGATLQQDALDLGFVPEVLVAIPYFHHAIRDDDQGVSRRKWLGELLVGCGGQDADGEPPPGEAFEGAVGVDEDGGYVACVDVGEGGAVGGDDAAEEGGVALGGGASVEGLVEVGEDLAEVLGAALQEGPEEGSGCWPS